MKQFKVGDEVELSIDWYRKEFGSEKGFRPATVRVIQDSQNGRFEGRVLKGDDVDSIGTYDATAWNKVVKYKTVQLLVAVTVRVPEQTHIHDIGIGRVQLRNANKADGTAKILQAVQLRS